MKMIPVLTALMFGATTATAQSAAVHVELGDRDYAAMRATAALAHYEEAIRLEPQNYDALWKASRSLGDIEAEARADAVRHEQIVSRAESYARRATAIKPEDAEAHFHLARALGLKARSVGARAKVRYGTAVRASALKCLERNPRHSGCNHVMGAWNAEVMRLSGPVRFIARTLLGGKVFGSASWAEAQRYLEAAVAESPERIVHHLELGQVYRDRKNRAKARAAFETVLGLPATDYNDARYKAEAEAILRTL